MFNDTARINALSYQKKVVIVKELIGARPLLKHFLSFNKWLGLVSSVDVLKWNVKPVPDELNSDRAYSHHRPVQKEPGLLLQLKWRYTVYARGGNDHDFAHYLSRVFNIY